jgi:hypothetical protein
MRENLFADVDNIETLIYQLAGFASVCWNPRPEGEFETEEIDLGCQDALARLHQLLDDKVEARVQYHLNDRA